jgi:2-keto-4-pentenoate hydratase/2-oxohepta-3-ene-1,7-dioic acid hydratase in catechol pathway
MSRLVAFSHADRQGFGIVEGEIIFDCSLSPPFLNARGLAEAIGRGAPEDLIASAKNATTRIPLAEVKLLPPFVDGEKCLCVGLNFKEHAHEAGLPIPARPSLFARFPSSLVGHGQPVVAPCLSSQFDFEGELVVIIGHSGRHVPESRAMDHVFGYTIMAENSVRDWQKRATQVTPGKNFFRSGALGPWCTTRDEFDIRKNSRSQRA